MYLFSVWDCQISGDKVWCLITDIKMYIKYILSYLYNITWNWKDKILHVHCTFYCLRCDML